MNKYGKYIIKLLIPILVIGVFSGCGQANDNKPSESIGSNISNTSGINIELSSDKVDDASVLKMDGTRSYLTGKKLDDKLVAKKPIAIMIENTEASLPHYNLDKAGFIYETPVESNMTRYMAVYDDWSKLDRIGNTRSARTYHIWLAAQYEAIFFHYGQSPFALPYLDMKIVDDVNGVYGEGNIAFYRSADKTAPHNAYTGAKEITAGINYKGLDTDHSSGYKSTWQFAADDSEVCLDSGADCTVIQPYYFYNTPYFIYNDEDKLYYRYEFGKPEVDAASGNQYAVRNIIFMNASNDMYVDGNGQTQYLNFYLPMTQGTGKYFTSGKMVDIMWVSGKDDEQFHFYYTDGTEIVLNQGQTWFCLIQNAYQDENKLYATKEEFEATK